MSLSFRRLIPMSRAEFGGDFTGFPKIEVDPRFRKAFREQAEMFDKWNEDVARWWRSQNQADRAETGDNAIRTK